MSKKAIKTIEKAIKIINEADISDIGEIAQIHEAIENAENSINKNKYPTTLNNVNNAKKLSEDIMLNNSKDAKADKEEIIIILNNAIESISKDKKENAPESTKEEIPLDEIDSIIDSSQEPTVTLTVDNQVMDVDIDLVTEFVNESRDHIQTAEECLLQLENNPEDLEDINSVFRTFHTMKGIAGFLGLSNIRSITHEAESILDNIRSGKSIITPSIIELFLGVIDHLKVIINNIDNAIKKSEPIKDYHADSEHLTAKIKNALLTNNEQSEMIPSISQSASCMESKQTSVTSCMEAIKVDANKLDHLINMVGELVVAKSMLIHDNHIQNINDPSFTQKSSQLDKITRELQEVVMSVRMVPLRQTFSKMKRLVRDTAKKANKEIDLIISGEDTEIDKGLVDLIGDPLIHMLRNSVDHGVESPPDRLLANKPEIGTINLSAYQKGGNICIEIQDDGKGLDKEQILKKAKEKQLITEDAILNEKEIFNLIFKPGFSTAKQITDISGRGVGMDVVRKNIEEMRGQVEIVSTKGIGTTFIIKLPITMAIIDGMVVRVGTEKYIIPILSIKESIATHNLKKTSLLNEIDTLDFHGNQVPIIYLEKVFNHKDTELIENNQNRISVIIEEDDKNIGIMVDELLGQQQVVIKSMDDSIQDCKGISGCAIMPDGTVGLILDVAGILQLA